MQIADALYSVTMQEQGVSKRVAVKFDQVDFRAASPNTPRPECGDGVGVTE